MEDDLVDELTKLLTDQQTDHTILLNKYNTLLNRFYIAVDALNLIAMPKRPDGTYNRDRASCEQIAKDAIGDINEVKES